MTELKEDAALATFYLLSLALGVTIVSMGGTNIDLLHVLFGSVLALDNQTLLLIAGNATITLVVLALIYRPLVIECVDPGFLRSVSGAGAPAHLAFLALVVINLVAGFHALGTLLAVGIMMLPAATGRFWARDITLMILIATVCGTCLGLCRAADLLPRRRAVGPGGDPGRRRALYACRCCSAMSAVWSGRCCHNAILKRKSTRSCGEHHAIAPAHHRVHRGACGLVRIRAGDGAGEAQGSRHLLDPRRFRQKCRRRSRRGHDAGRPQ